MLKKFESSIGKKALYRPHREKDITFEVKVLDIKSSYGNLRYQISPIAGKGTRWVEEIELIKSA